MSRVRRRQARRTTEDRDWQERRGYVLQHFPGDALLECSEFWAREPGVPDKLRADPERWRHLMASPERAEAILAERAALLDARRAWLSEH